MRIKEERNKQILFTDGNHAIWVPEYYGKEGCECKNWAEFMEKYGHDLFSCDSLENFFENNSEDDFID